MFVAELKERHMAATETVNDLRERLKQKRLHLLDTEVSGYARSQGKTPKLREAFDFFDSDHDGWITAEELHAVFAAIGDEQCTLEDCRRMISGVDKNMDGFVCFRDFARMMERQR
ncbi:hypothetical protein ACSBR1_037946 [Camellia fascicularis]